MRTLPSDTLSLPARRGPVPPASVFTRSAENCCARAGRTETISSAASIVDAAMGTDLDIEASREWTGRLKNCRRRSSLERQDRRRNEIAQLVSTLLSVGLIVRLAVKVEGIEQVINRRHVRRYVGIVVLCLR